VPRDLEVICLKCLEKDSRRRYSSGLALAQDLERFQAGEPILARPEGALRKLARRFRRQRTPLLAGLAVLVALGVALAFYLGTRGVHRASALQAQIEAGLETPEWTAEPIAALEIAITELDRLSPGQGEAYRQRLLERWKRHLLTMLARPRLEPDDVAAFRQGLAGLETRLPAAGPELRLRLQERLANWEEAFALQAPFLELEAIFANRDGPVRDGKVLALAGSGPPAARPIRTLIPCRGNARVEAVFADSWQQAPELGLLLYAAAGHAKSIKAIRYAPDGKLLASADDGGTVRLWDPVAGIEVRALDCGAPAYSLLFVAEGRQLVVGVQKAVQIWDVDTGQRLRVLPVRGGAVTSLAVSSDGKLLATAVGDPIIPLWRLADGQAAGELAGHEGPVHALAFAPRGQLLASSGKDGSVRFWDVVTRRQEAARLQHPAPRVVPGLFPGRPDPGHSGRGWGAPVVFASRPAGVVYQARLRPMEHLFSGVHGRRPAGHLLRFGRQVPTRYRYVW